MLLCWFSCWNLWRWFCLRILGLGCDLIVFDFGVRLRIVAFVCGCGFVLLDWFGCLVVWVV